MTRLLLFRVARGVRRGDARRPGLTGPSGNCELGHAVLCLCAWNTNLYCKSQPIQTNGLALVPGVGGVYTRPFPAAPAQREPPSLGPSWAAAKRVARGQGRV